MAIRVLNQIIILLVIGFYNFASANEVKDEQPTALVLIREVNTDFTPEQAFFIVRFSQRVISRIPALILPAADLGAAETASLPSQGIGRKWLLGGLIEVPRQFEVFSLSALVLGRNGAVTISPDYFQQTKQALTFRAAEQVLRTELTELQGKLTPLKLQMAGQENLLRRLRSDAEVVGNFGRVVDAREELSKVRGLIASADKDIANLERFARLANSYPMPKNYRAREQQLASQLTELTEAARRAEQGEGARRYDAQFQMQERLRLLELARTESVDALQEELGILRAERERLEGSHGRQAKTPEIKSESASEKEAQDIATADEL